MELEDLIYDDDLDVLDIIHYDFPRAQIERTEYFHNMDDLSFFRRFRLTKPTVERLLEEIEDQLSYNNHVYVLFKLYIYLILFMCEILMLFITIRNNPVSPMNQLLLTLRFYASNGHQLAIGDFMGCAQSTTSRIISKVSRAIAGLRPIYVKMPETNVEKLRTQEEFYTVARFPRVMGVIDCTHVRIQSPGK